MSHNFNILSFYRKSAGKSPKALAESNPEILALIEKASKLPLGQTKDNSGTAILFYIQCTMW